MAMPAQWDSTVLFPARPRFAADGPMRVRAGTYSVEIDADDVVSGWHTHDVHQLEYAFEGTIELETATARHLLPPQQAAWIPAGVRHSSRLAKVKSVSVFFDPAMGLPAGDRVRILAAAPVIREMIVYAKRWPVSRGSSDAMADAFFTALAYLVVEWLDHETPLFLPTSREPLIAAIMAHTNAHLAEVTSARVCAAVGTSERTLRRAFPAATGMSWRQYLVESRLLRAMTLLAADERTVLAIAHAVGFHSVSAFTRAFGRYTGQTPTAYRQRVQSGQLASSADPNLRAVRQWSNWPDSLQAL